MENAPPDGLKKLKKQLRASIFLASLLIVAAWAVYLTAELFRFDLVKREHISDDAQQNAYLYLAIVLTVLSAIFAWIATRKNIDLVKRGVWIHGNIEKISSLGKGGTRPVTFAYQVGGVEFKKKKDVPKLFNSQYIADTRVWVIYDPQNPKRCEVLLKPI
jgi:hypothetical protein